MVMITPQQVISRWTGDDAPQVTDAVLATLTEDAEALALWDYPTLPARLLGKPAYLRIVQMVLSQAVQRAYNSSANGKNQYSYTSGPFSESGSYAGNSDTRGSIYFTDAEKQKLAGGQTNEAFKINLDTRPSRSDINGSGGLYPYLYDTINKPTPSIYDIPGQNTWIEGW